MVIEDKNANVPAEFIGYPLPPHDHPDTPALPLLGQILAEGESRRLYKRLVKDEEAALVVFGGVDSRKGPSLFRFAALANSGVPIERCEELILDEIRKLQEEGVTEKELEKAKAQFKASFVSSRETVLGKAEELHHYAYFHDDLSEINTDLDEYMKVTVDDIVRVAKRYLIDRNRTVVIANTTGREG
jgi:zinc protease